MFGIVSVIAEAIGNRTGGRGDEWHEGDGRDAGDAQDEDADAEADEAVGGEDGPAGLKVDGDGGHDEM